MKYFDYREDSNVFVCEIIEENKIKISGYRGQGARVMLPEYITNNEKEYQLVGIGKKAFLGNRSLKRVELPESVEFLEDWAFSQCVELDTVVIKMGGPQDLVELGNGVFAECPKISRLAIKVSEEDDIAVLHAVTIHKLPSEDLLKDVDLGTQHWYQKWDQRLLTFLRENDEEGYTNMVLCGEEDIRRSIPQYCSDKRKKKASLCMLRMLHDASIEAEARTAMKNYLLSHTKGCEQEDAWQVVLSDYGQQLEYFKLLVEEGIAHKDNIDAMMKDMGTEHAEAKAFLLNYKQEHFSSLDVFDMFSI